MAKYTKRRHVRKTKRHGKKHGKRRGTRRYRGGGKSGLYASDGTTKLSGPDGAIAGLKEKQITTGVTESSEAGAEQYDRISVSIMDQCIELLDGAVRIKTGVNLYKISITKSPFSMTWTKQGLGIFRSLGRAAASVGLTTKTENSEDTAAQNIAAMYPTDERDRIVTGFKQIVGGKGWASVADNIVFTCDKISIKVGMISGTKVIEINKPDDENSFKDKIKNIYINMNDDTITKQPGQQNLMAGIPPPNENDT